MTEFFSKPAAGGIIERNVDGDYPIMVQVFICRAGGKALNESDESRNIRWVSLNDLSNMLRNGEDSFFPMHIATLEKYLRSKGK